MNRLFWSLCLGSTLALAACGAEEGSSQDEPDSTHDTSVSDGAASDVMDSGRGDAESDIRADAETDVADDVSDASVTLNACGGLSDLMLEGSRAEPGDSCGCGGLVVCDGGETVRCVGDSPPNECGGCETLEAQPDTACGACGSSVWTCSETGEEVVCEASAELNLCGGCGELVGTPGHVCDSADGVGIWACDGDESVLCVGDGRNACGGFSLLPALPSTPCGECLGGVFVCDGRDDVWCANPSRRVNACGGCGALNGTPEGECGCGGTWACDDDQPGLLVCEADAPNECGGCDALDPGIPGEACDGGVLFCASPDALVCGGPEFNACGGLDELALPPGQPCGECGQGRTICTGLNATSCVGARGTNACGGCGNWTASPGESCATGATWTCDGPSVVCTISASANACGGRRPLAGVPGATCGECGIWSCEGREDVRCVRNTDDESCSMPSPELCGLPGDEDGDGDTNCDDSDCATYPDCTAGPEVCATRIDEDGDGLVGCDDPDCADSPVCAGGSENCADGVDNDGDRAVDCDDVDCTASSVCTSPREVCQGGSDEDGDGLTDCSDPDCFDESICERVEICDNGFDDDGDVSIDCDDPDCESADACVAHLRFINARVGTTPLKFQVGGEAIGEGPFDTTDMATGHVRPNSVDNGFGFFRYPAGEYFMDVVIYESGELLDRQPMLFEPGGFYTVWVAGSAYEAEPERSVRLTYAEFDPTGAGSELRVLSGIVLPDELEFFAEVHQFDGSIHPLDAFSGTRLFTDWSVIPEGRSRLESGTDEGGESFEFDMPASGALELFVLGDPFNQVDADAYIVDEEGNVAFAPTSPQLGVLWVPNEPEPRSWTLASIDDGTVFAEDVAEVSHDTDSIQSVWSGTQNLGLWPMGTDVDSPPAIVLGEFDFTSDANVLYLAIGGDLASLEAPEPVASLLPYDRSGAFAYHHRVTNLTTQSYPVWYEDDQETYVPWSTLAPGELTEPIDFSSDVSRSVGISTDGIRYADVASGYAGYDDEQVIDLVLFEQGDSLALLHFGPGYFSRVTPVTTGSLQVLNLSPSLDSDSGAGSYSIIPDAAGEQTTFGTTPAGSAQINIDSSNSADFGIYATSDEETPLYEFDLTIDAGLNRLAMLYDRGTGTLVTTGPAPVGPIVPSNIALTFANGASDADSVEILLDAELESVTLGAGEIYRLGEVGELPPTITLIVEGGDEEHNFPLPDEVPPGDSVLIAFYKNPDPHLYMTWSEASVIVGEIVE